GRQGVAIGRKRDKYSERRRFAPLGGGKGGGAGTGHHAGWNVRRVPDRGDREADQHEGSNQVFDGDPRHLVCACNQSVGQKKDGRTFRGTAQRLFFRGADRLFAQALSNRIARPMPYAVRPSPSADRELSKCWDVSSRWAWQPKSS